MVDQDRSGIHRRDRGSGDLTDVVVVADAHHHVGVTLTGRIGPGMVTHLAFNATGLAVVLWF